MMFWERKYSVPKDVGARRCLALGDQLVAPTMIDRAGRPADLIFTFICDFLIMMIHCCFIFIVKIKPNATERHAAISMR